MENNDIHSNYANIDDDIINIHKDNINNGKTNTINNDKTPSIIPQLYRNI